MGSETWTDFSNGEIPVVGLHVSIVRSLSHLCPGNKYAVCWSRIKSGDLQMLLGHN